MSKEVIQGDCLEVMRSIPDGSIDACITDPPYGTTACSWDSVIPFAPMWAALKRVVKKNGAIALFGSQPFTSALVMSNPQMFKYSLVWEKSNATGFVHAKNKPLKAHEDIAVFSLGTTIHEGQSDIRMTYHPQMTKGDPYQKTQRSIAQKHLHSPSVANINFIGVTSINEGVRYPRSVISYANPHGVETLHTSEKPVDLMRYLVRTYTNEGDTVLDFTCGSGSTGVACAIEKRNFVGIEQDAHYVEVSRARISRACGVPADIPMRNKPERDLPLFR